jgi:hypothetical protein
MTDTGNTDRIYFLLHSPNDKGSRFSGASKYYKNGGQYARDCSLTVGFPPLTIHIVFPRLIIMKFTTIAAALTLAFSSVVESASIPRAALDVWVPPIISPNESTVWKVGALETVTW